MSYLDCQVLSHYFTFGGADTALNDSFFVRVPSRARGVVPRSVGGHWHYNLNRNTAALLIAIYRKSTYGPFG